MAKRTRVPGHHLQRHGKGTWCSCGRYIGGLHHVGVPAIGIRDRFALHKVQVLNAQR